MTKRSMAMTIFGWSEILCGVAGTCWFLLVMLSEEDVLAAIGEPGYLAELAFFYSPFLPMPLLIGLGLGMLQLKPWARWLSLAVINGDLLWAVLFGLFAMSEGEDPLDLVVIGAAIALAGLNTWFLLSPHVKRQFAIDGRESL